MCMEESYANIKPTIEQFKFIAIEKDDGIQNVFKTVIKVSSQLVIDDIVVATLKRIWFILYRQSMLMDIVLSIVGKLLTASGYVVSFNTVLR